LGIGSDTTDAATVVAEVDSELVEPTQPQQVINESGDATFRRSECLLDTIGEKS
jgi:hypothetical protein